MTESIRALLNRLIDYAGLFPPARLELSAAARNFMAHRAGEHAWALGRFVMPASRLNQLAETGGDPPFAGPVSALSGQDLTSDMENILAFQQRYAIDAVEVKVSTPAEAVRARKIVPAASALYLELPACSHCGDWLAAIAAAGASAKVRTGGLTAEMFPSPSELAAFLHAACSAGVAFKATAGLHHPIRCVRPLTYDRGSPVAPMHGFLNVFLAAAFVRAGISTRETIELLAEESPSAFVFEDDVVSWRTHRITRDDILQTRRTFALSFGSCSFEEPIEELKALRLL